MYGIIYKIENIINEKCYIGQTIQNLDKRKSQHICNANKGYNFTICNAIRKYGKENFNWTIIKECNNRKELDEKEKYYIEFFNSYKQGYNMTLGGDFNPMFDEEIKKRAIKNIKKAMKKFTGVNNPMNNPGVREKHKKAVRNLVKTQGWKEVKKIGDNKQKCYYEITNPEGKILIIHGLNEFCKLNNLSQSKMSSVSTGNRQHHKKYKCKKVFPNIKPEDVSNNYYNDRTKIGKSINAKSYIITKPDNKKLTIKNLTKFCRENSLAYISMLAVASKRQIQHKGFKCEKV